MHHERDWGVTELVTAFDTIWLQSAPPAARLVGGSRINVSYALDGGGHGWAVVQAYLHPHQITQPSEFEAFPGGLLHVATHHLHRAGAALPDRLVATTFGQPGPAANLITHARPRLVSVDATNLLGFEWIYEPYRFLVTIHRQRWLAALLPADAPGQLVTRPRAGI